MKKLLVFLLTLLTLTAGAFALDIDVSVDSSNFHLFDAYGDRMDLSDARIEEGLILLNGDGWLDISTTYGSIRLAPESLLSVLSLDPAHPILYLVTGDASFFTTEDFYLEVYTPVSLVSTDRSGEFRITSTADAEKIYNMNNGWLRVLDAMTGTVAEIGDLSWIDQIEGTIGDMDSVDYGDTALFISEDDGNHIFQDLGLPVIASVEGSDLERVLRDNFDIRVVPTWMKAPGVPEVGVKDIEVRDPSIPRIAEGLTAVSRELYDPEELLPAAPIVEVTDRTIPEELSEETVPGKVTDMSSESELASPAVPSAPALTIKESILTDPLLSEEVTEETEEVPAEEATAVPTAPEWIGVPERYMFDPTVPSKPVLTCRISVPTAPQLAVKSSVIMRGFVPEAPEFISSKSAPSFLIPERPMDLRVKEVKYVEPLAAPIVNVYEDGPGFNSWDAETYRPSGSTRPTASEKKTIPTLTSSSK